MKPSLQFLELIANNPEKLFQNYINKEVNRRKNITSIMDYVNTDNLVQEDDVVEDIIEDIGDDDLDDELERLESKLEAVSKKNTKTPKEKINKSTKGSKNVKKPTIIEELDKIKHESSSESDDEIKKRIRNNKTNNKKSLIIEL